MNASKLYVLEEKYDEIANGDYSPWSKFLKLMTYDPSNDPYFSSVKTVTDDSEDEIDYEKPLTYSLSMESESPAR